MRSPLVACLGCTLLGGLFLAWSLRPIPDATGLADLTLRWAYPAGLLGAALGLVPLSRGGPFLARLDPRTRWQGELGALTLAGLYLQLPVLAGGLLAGAAPSEPGRALPAILTFDLHLACVAHLLLLPPLSTASRVTLLLAGVWVVPALCAPYPALARAVAPLDAGLALRAETPAQLLPALGLAAALALVGILLRTPAARTRPA